MFLFLGERWVNVDNISIVDIKQDTNKQTYCTVYFKGGLAGLPAGRNFDQDFTGEQAKIILDYLQNHRANRQGVP